MFPQYTTVRAMQAERFPTNAESVRHRRGSTPRRNWSRVWDANIVRGYSSRLKPRKERTA
jgi:hypothetical protein